MTELPSLNNMGPDSWVAAMHAARERVIQEVSGVLNVRTTPDEAAAPLQRIFDEYRPEDLGRLFEQELGDSERALQVQKKDEALTFWVFPTEEYESIVYTSFGYWWYDHGGTSDHHLSRQEVHRHIAGHLVQLLPWANEDDLLELAAIEIASRSG